MSIQHTMRVEWSELRRSEGYFCIIAEWNGSEWEFWERDSWEVRWYAIAATEERTSRANAARGARSDSQSLPGIAA
jgi:hypothetical protein